MLDTTLLLSNTDRFRTHEAWTNTQAIPLLPNKAAPKSGGMHEQEPSMYVGHPTDHPNWGM
jgi:hypothetical protein